MARYRHERSIDVYRKVPDDNPWWAWVILAIIILAVLGQCAG